MYYDVIWGRIGGITPTFLNSALDGGELSATRLERFTPWGESLTCPWMSSRADVDAVE